jgi:hypothetical protein
VTCKGCQKRRDTLWRWWTKFTGVYWLRNLVRSKNVAMFNLIQANHRDLCTIANQLESRIGDAENKMKVMVAAGAEVEQNAEDRQQVIREEFQVLRAVVNALKADVKDAEAELSELSEDFNKIDFPEFKPIEFKLDEPRKG